jgi:hypothetical protein
MKTLSLLLLIAGAASAQVVQMRPELTEQHGPVPPVIQAPAGKAPSDAIVLFDGTSAAAWQAVKPESKGWTIADGAWTVTPKDGNMRTKQVFGDVQMHLEFRSPTVVKGAGQGRGNSGILFMDGRYEVQVLDSYENTTYVNGQAASLYKHRPPLVNASRSPGEWQTYDIIFIAPRFAADGRMQSPARATVFHNGVLVQYDVELLGKTDFRGAHVYDTHAAKLPIVLQDHSDLVSFRNIWIREIASPTPAGLAGMPRTPGWESLFNGVNLDGWETWLGKPDKTMTVAGMARAADGTYNDPIGLNKDPLGVFSVVTNDGRPAIRISGEVNGALSKVDPRGNYRLTAEYKWGPKRPGRADRPRNSGLLYHGHGEQGAVNGNFLTSLEFQMMEGNAGDLYTMGPVGVFARVLKIGEKGWVYNLRGETAEFGPTAPNGRRVQKQGTAEKTGGWNRLELVCFGDQSVHILNGEIVLRLDRLVRIEKEGDPATPLPVGRIQFQSEGAELFLRDIRIQTLLTAPNELR